MEETAQKELRKEVKRNLIKEPFKLEETNNITGRNQFFYKIFLSTLCILTDCKGLIYILRDVCSMLKNYLYV